MTGVVSDGPIDFQKLLCREQWLSQSYKEGIHHLAPSPSRVSVVFPTKKGDATNKAALIPILRTLS
jgi:hypothetical protein